MDHHNRGLWHELEGGLDHGAEAYYDHHNVNHYNDINYENNAQSIPGTSHHQYTQDTNHQHDSYVNYLLHDTTEPGALDEHLNNMGYKLDKSQHDHSSITTDRRNSEAVVPADTATSHSEQFFSPSLSFQGTPLLSPHALAPQPYTNTARLRTQSSGKITKQSPSIARWRSSSISDLDDLGDFNLGDPAMSFLDEVVDPLNQKSPNPVQSQPQPHPHPQSPYAVIQQHDVDEKLQAAIAATTNIATNRRSSVGSSRIPSNPSSHRGSRSNTPRIRAKLSVSSNTSEGSSPQLHPQMETSRSVSAISNDGSYDSIANQHLISQDNRLTGSLKSKRDEHKIAEKERRNRLSNAITELASLISPVQDRHIGSLSKAATVERATVYIRQLHSRIAELESQLKSYNVHM